jgi:hypothetical protein
MLQRSSPGSLKDKSTRLFFNKMQYFLIISRETKFKVDKIERIKTHKMTGMGKIESFHHPFTMYQVEGLQCLVS